MKQASTFISLLILLVFAACQQSNNDANDTDGLAAFSTEVFKQNVAVLASDSFMGRKPFTKGETLTIDYLQKQFSQIGLEPGNDNSYLQEVPMVNILAKAAPTMQVQSSKEKFELKAYDEYIIWTNKTDENISLDNTDLVFAGYGVVAPEHNWNDYEGLDVKGKVVLVMVNDPGFWIGDTSMFKGKTMTYYGRWTYKFEEAARQGAKGCLIIHNPSAAGYPFAVQQNIFNTGRLQLVTDKNNNTNSDVIGWMTEATANKLFVAAGFDSTLLQKANVRGFKALPLNLKVSTSMAVTATHNRSYNVLGKITGSKRPEEVIIYTAHWDHFGVGKPDDTGDSIYNGALDNATGTAGLIELARAFKALKSKPERTIIFLSVTAEEQGLLGSAYYAEHPVFPAKNTVANINIDGLNRFARTRDMVVFGEGQSELEDYLNEELRKDSGYISYDPHPEAGYYYRSDHFNFAKKGIPALFANYGSDMVGKGKAVGQAIEEKYTAENYHQPSDEFDPATWSCEGAMQDLKVFFKVGKRLAFESSWPEWKPGSEFKLIRDKSKKD